MLINTFTTIAGRFGIKEKEAERFFKFLIVGTIGFVLDFGLLTTQVELFGLPTRIAALTPFSKTMGLVACNTVSFTAAVLSNFSFSRYWIYPESRSKRKRIQLPQFVLVSVIGLILNNTILVTLERPFDLFLHQFSIVPEAVSGYIPAKIAATIVVLFWNFFVNRYWTYGNVDNGE